MQGLCQVNVNVLARKNNFEKKKSFWSGFTSKIWKFSVADSKLVLCSICSFLNIKS